MGAKKMRRQSIFLMTFSLLFLTILSISFIPPFIHASEAASRIIEGKIKEGETFSQSLAKKKLSPHWITLIVSKLRPYVDFRRIRAGESYQWVADENGDLVKFIYEINPTEVYEIEKDSKGKYVVKKKEVPLEIYLIKAEGEIYTSLAKAMKDVGEHWSLATTFAEVLAWEVDFSQDVRRGDRFKVVVEKLYKGDQFIKYGAIHALEYQSGKKIIRGIRFKNRYYDEKGYSLERAFLKMPLRFNYISSGFNPNRRHPIMGGVHPHLGIDYAAPLGTPVWAVASGIVIFCGWVEGFGNQVVIEHPNGYTSYYGHLSRFGPRIKEGKHVEQKQVIGYVGSTGLSTGPHLDFRLSKNGKFINPLKEPFPVGQPVGKEEMDAFQKKKDEVMAWLKNESPIKIRLTR
jgi:murein DD-endopeptidase MepM/ murein hydrolase activator NlpD